MEEEQEKKEHVACQSHISDLSGHDLVTVLTGLLGHMVSAACTDSLILSVIWLPRHLLKIRPAWFDGLYGTHGFSYMALASLAKTVSVPRRPYDSLETGLGWPLQIS